MEGRLNKIADYVIKKLKERGFIIQRYDSITTNSIYLKLDYGLSNSIRISDHKGKKGLDYRFNLIDGRKGFNVHNSPKGYDRFYYPTEMVVKMLNDIIRHRHNKITKYGYENYCRYMEENWRDNKDAKGFWSQSYLV